MILLIFENLLRGCELFMNRHKDLQWTKIESRLKMNIDNLWSLNEMEESGGEPDVTGFDLDTGAYIFIDCSAESPKGRRSINYDREGLVSRKVHKPKTKIPFHWVP